MTSNFWFCIYLYSTVVTSPGSSTTSTFHCPGPNLILPLLTSFFIPWSATYIIGHNVLRLFSLAGTFNINYFRTECFFLSQLLEHSFMQILVNISSSSTYVGITIRTRLLKYCVTNPPLNYVFLSLTSFEIEITTFKFFLENF